jgi:hypothetical protein
MHLPQDHCSIIGEEANPSFPFFNNIVVFGLRDRVDRWQRCQEIFESNGITKVTKYVTEKHENKHREAIKDFLKMLELKRGSDLMFFENDFELVDGWEPVLRKAWMRIPRDFDLLYLGANLTAPMTKISYNLVKINGCWQVHAVVLSKTFIDYVLMEYDLYREWAFDDWLRKIAIRRKFYMTYPMISYQRAGYSDYANKVTSYDIFSNKFYKQGV